MLEACKIFLVIILLPVAALAGEADILDIAKEHPLGVLVNGQRARYGNPDLAEAVDALSDIPRPWTVPKIIALFEQESEEWSSKLAKRISEKNHHMWAGSDKEEQRCGHLATLLAASRDPRAGLVLGKCLDKEDTFPGAVRVIDGLFNYFVGDSRYHRVPNEDDGVVAYSNMYPMMAREVRKWWSLNKEELKDLVKKYHADLPYATPVLGHPGFVSSPYGGGYVDVRGHAAGTEFKCPYTGKIFLIP